MIRNQPPNHHIWTALSRMTQLNQLIIGLNVSEKPMNAFKTSDSLERTNLNNFTIHLQKTVN